MKSVDAIVAGLFLICGCGIGSSYVGAARQSKLLPEEPGFNQRVFGAALMSVCGRGLITPIVPMVSTADTPPAHRPLIDFLAQRRETFSCQEIPTDVPADGLDGMQRASRYLLFLVTSTWNVSGPVWSGIDRLLGLMFGLSVALAYLIGRLGMGRLVATGFATLMMLSPLHLSNLPDLRDYSKTPFFLVSLLIVGVLVAHRQRPVRVVALSAAAGAVLGFGFGVRTDIIVNLVVLLGAIVAFLPERWADSWKLRLVAVMVCLSAFVAVASPILTTRESGSNLWHWALLGYAHEWDNALNVAPAPYEPGYFYNDSYVATVVDAYWSRTTRAPGKVSVGMSQYEEASRDYYTRIVETFPADALLRGWAAVIQILDLPYSGIHSLPRGLLPDWLTRLIAIIGHGRVLFAGMGVVLFASVVLAVSSLSLRLAALMFGMVAFLGAYPAIQFQQRHVFHLEVLSLWLIGFAASSVVSAVVRRSHGGSVPGMARGQSAPRAWRAVAFGLAAVAFVVVPLMTLRAYQQRTATALMAAYRDARIDSIDVPPERIGNGMVRLARGQDWLPPRRGQRSMYAEMLVAEVQAGGCGVDRSALTFRYTTKNPSVDFTRTYDIDMPAGAPPTRVYFPVYETGPSDPDPEVLAFAGLEVAESELHCVIHVGRFADPDGFPLLLPAVLPADWHSLPLHQTLRGWERDPLAVGPRTVSYWAPLSLRDRQSAILAGLSTAQPGIDAVLEYRAQIVRVGPNAVMTVDGVADAPASYLVAWKLRPFASSTVVAAEGKLERGGLTVGLVEGTNWAVSVEIDRPGAFRALVQAPRPGQYQLVVANHLSNTSLRSRFTISRMASVDAP